MQGRGHHGVARRACRTWKPDAEPLEGRRLLTAGAAQVGFREIPSNGSVELLIVGTNKPDSITINDNGTAAVGNVSVTLGNGSTYTSQSAISAIVVQGKGGNDQVAYNLTGPLIAARTVIADLGAGNDQFTANLAGAINNATGLDLEAYGDGGNDNLSVVQTGATLQGNVFPYLSGGAGNDTLSYQGTGTIASGAGLTPGLDGGAGNDQITSNYSGVVNGEYMYNLSINGGAGNDVIADTVNVGAGSTGTIGDSASTPAVVEGGPGNDQITFAIRADPTSTAVVNAYAIGGPGRDAIQHTANVLNDNTDESDTVIS